MLSGLGSDICMLLVILKMERTGVGEGHVVWG